MQIYFFVVFLQPWGTMHQTRWGTELDCEDNQPLFPGLFLTWFTAQSHKDWHDHQQQGSKDTENAKKPPPPSVSA